MRSLLILSLLAGTVHADDAADDLGDLMREETEFVAGPHGLEITYTWQHDTSTWHTANHLTIAVAAAKIERATDDEHMILPLFAKAFDAGANRWVLLGWSSTGSGMQTQTAWIVKKVGNKLQIADELDWTTDRGHPGLAFEGEGAKLRVGILKPPASDDDAHDAGEWSLETGGKLRRMDVVRKLKFVAGTPALYAPPFDDAKCPCKIAWLGIAHDKFVVQ
jgi:hypothetical protein